MTRLSVVSIVCVSVGMKQNSQGCCEHARISDESDNASATAGE